MVDWSIPVVLLTAIVEERQATNLTAIDGKLPHETILSAVSTSTERLLTVHLMSKIAHLLSAPGTLHASRHR